MGADDAMDRRCARAGGAFFTEERLCAHAWVVFLNEDPLCTRAWVIFHIEDCSRTRAGAIFHIEDRLRTRAWVIFHIEDRLRPRAGAIFHIEDRPQAVRLAIPPLTNWVIAITKSTALGSFVAVPEILSQASSAQSSLANPSPLTFAAFLFLVIFAPLVMFTRWLERRYGWRR